MSAQGFSLSAQHLSVRPKGFGHGLSRPLAHGRAPRPSERQVKWGLWGPAALFHARLCRKGRGRREPRGPL